MVLEAGLSPGRCAWEDPDGVLQRVARAALDLVPAAEGAAVDLVDGDGSLVPICVEGMPSWPHGRRLPRIGSLSGVTLATRTAQRCDDAENDPRVDRAACRTANARSLVCVPLVRGQDPIGVFTVTSSSCGAFDDPVVETLGELASFLATVIGTVVRMSDAAALPARHAAGARRVATADVLGSSVDVSPPAAEGGGAVVLLDRAATIDADRVAAFVSEVIQPGAAATAAVRARLGDVIARRAVSMVFQPVLKLARRTPVAVEALARFPGPPQQTPDVWFDQAHAVGLGVELELLAVEEALRVLPRLPPNILLSINASPTTVASRELAALLSAVDPRRVAVEVTEHVAVDDYGPLRRRIDHLRALGARISIDDTGSGYASFRHILSLSPDFIKLDLALTRNIDRDPARRALATALVGFVRESGARLIAEGIETSGELGAVEELGIELGQGYHIGRPVPFEALDIPGIRR